MTFHSLYNDHQGHSFLLHRQLNLTLLPVDSLVVVYSLIIMQLEQFGWAMVNLHTFSPELL